MSAIEDRELLKLPTVLLAHPEAALKLMVKRELHTDFRNDFVEQSLLRQAQEELAVEKKRAAIDTMKIKLRSRKWWHGVFPFEISITRRS